MLLSKDPRDLATTEVCLNLVSLIGSVHEASGSNLVLSPPSHPLPTRFCHIFETTTFNHFFATRLLPGAAAVSVSCAADLPEVTGQSGEERSLPASAPKD